MINIHNFGLIWLLAHFLPVYWQQDTECKNNGYDILSFRNNGNKHYFRGTINQRFNNTGLG